MRRPIRVSYLLRPQQQQQRPRRLVAALEDVTTGRWLRRCSPQVRVRRQRLWRPSPAHRSATHLSTTRWFAGVTVREGCYNSWSRWPCQWGRSVVKYWGQGQSGQAIKLFQAPPKISFAFHLRHNSFMLDDVKLSNNSFEWKKRSEETQTLRAGCK